MKRKKMIEALADRHLDYLDRESQITELLKCWYENMPKKRLKNSYRDNIQDPWDPEIFINHGHGKRVEMIVLPGREMKNPNQLELFEELE